MSYFKKPSFSVSRHTNIFIKFHCEDWFTGMYSMDYYASLHCTTEGKATVPCTLLYSTIIVQWTVHYLHCIALHCNLLCLYSAVHYTVLIHCTALYCALTVQ